MKLSCIFGHKWRGCTCERCGETRDTGHNFDSCKGKCTICGKPCEVKHQWNGCKCKKCGLTRDEGHKWNPCKGKCDICGKSCPVEHDWDGCTCRRCGETRDEEHQWKGTRCLRCGKTRVLPPVKKDRMSDYAEEDRVAFGKWNGEPLIWRVLKVEEDRMLWITDRLLGARAYHRSGACTWDTCTLREDLNGSWFYANPDVFTDAERALILPVTNDSPGIYYQNKKNFEEFYTNKGNPVEDRVFLLSVTEACQAFHVTEDGWMQDSMGYKAYLFPQSADLILEDKPWWLRNATRKGNAAVVVTAFGNVNYNGFSVTEMTIVKVRPAMWVSRADQAE